MAKIIGIDLRNHQLSVAAVMEGGEPTVINVRRRRTSGSRQL